MGNQYGKANRFLFDAVPCDIRLSDFCDMEKFDQMMRDWAESTGLATVAVDNKGEYISGYYNFTDFCERLTRKSAEGLKRCIECDKKGKGIYLCHAGLVDFATPITLEDGTYLGSIVGGQVLPLRPDEEKFRRLADELNIDEDTYINALRKVNVRSEYAIKASAELLGNVINMFVRSSYTAHINASSLMERAHIISSLAKIYFCCYFINVEEDSYIELDATENLHEYAKIESSASKLTDLLSSHFIETEFLSYYQAFTDLPTLAERMGDSDSISYEFIAKKFGWCRGTFIKVAEDKKEMFHVIYVIQSIQTEKEHDFAVREKLQEAAVKANLASMAKTDFLARMSHDIRTPLNGIIGMNYLAMEETDDPKLKEYLHRIDTSSKFLLSLINDILDVSKAESGKIELHPEPYPISEFNLYIKSVIEPLCQQKNIRFELHENVSANEIPFLDIARSNQVTFNLLSNAVKYTPQGGTVSFTVNERQISPGRAEIEQIIADTGIGMSREFLEHMYEPFTREYPTADGRSGSGLGLAIVKNLVSLMGGTIKAVSEQGRGTTITVTYPADMKDKSVLDELNKATEQPAPLRMDGMRLLLCEDNALNAQIACQLLQLKGAAADAAVNGREGLEMFAQSAPGTYAAVLMDIRMPEMDGLTAARKIRALAREDAKTVPIIAMTANAYKEDVKKCMDAGMNAFIPKPIDPDKMYQIIMEAVGRK